MFLWCYGYLQEDHVESDDNLTQKTRLFFNKAVKTWDADFYVKMDDNIGLNIGELSAPLAIKLLISLRN